MEPAPGEQGESLPNRPTTTLAALAATSTATSTVAKVIDKVIAVATPSESLRPLTGQAIKEIVTPLEISWKRGIATVFWVGEGETEDNDYITNVESAWDGRWMEHYGGLDDPEERCGFEPCAFEPKENPFYVALPYNDLDDDGRTKANAQRIPWFATSSKSILKNRWIEVRVNGKSCFGEWQDVGPFEEDDVEYVFGDAKTPKNQFGEKAGIDLSPALADCLRIDGSESIQWRHVEESQVPAGDWRKIITTRR